MVRSNVKSGPRVLKQSRRIYDPRTTAITPNIKVGVGRMGVVVKEEEGQTNDVSSAAR